MHKNLLISIGLTMLATSCFLTDKRKEYDSGEEVQVMRSQIQSAENFLVHWIWEDEFNDEEKQKIQLWLNSTIDATENVLGEFPFDLYIYLHRQDEALEPVPWAHTSRGEEQSVHFYVDPVFTLDEFLDDWTAPHEISHLSLPFLGKENSWFAEGYATYMQCQVLHAMDRITMAGVKNKFHEKITMVKAKFDSEKPFTEVIDSLVKKHDFPAIYWGSATFFLWSDELLRREGFGGLNALIRKYQACCRLEGHRLDELILSLDSLSHKHIFSDLLNRYSQQSASNINMDY